MVVVLGALLEVVAVFLTHWHEFWVLAALFLHLVLLLFEILLQCPYLLAEFVDVLNKCEVAFHNANVLFTVDLAFHFESLLDRRHRVVQVLLLVIVLGLNVLVKLHVLHLLIFDVLVERAGNRAFQLVVIVDVLNYIVDSVFETLYGCFVVANCVSVLLDYVLHLDLLGSQIVNIVAEFCINGVVLL